MSAARDIIGAYRAPRRVFARRLAATGTEAQALVILMTACLLVFVSQAPVLQRQAIATGEDLNPLLGGALFAWLFIMPLAAYAISWISHLIARAMGGQGSPLASRLALFWALLVAAPLWMLNGLVLGFLGESAEANIVGAIALGAFVIHWAVNLVTAQSPRELAA
ncbi:YIP1 family protein [Maritimibacter sp. DP1N21-5]|uniref:YIP1 family protein n=1 Tax=Maritimibacter sp. DP1N21-5 TaxID=2836867 RepID=UPI001C44CC77|nr:YIP1 family protein [Maritimibacter sp. DP1N21-5]MBV7409815.1 YIP1 family protein [Maritimibacter sp. DP1N21-5]